MSSAGRWQADEDAAHKRKECLPSEEAPAGQGETDTLRRGGAPEVQGETEAGRRGEGEPKDAQAMPGETTESRRAEVVLAGER